MPKSSRFIVDAEDLVVGVEKRYSPSQPRDSRGRWTDGASLEVTDYEGEVGNRQHITRTARGRVQVDRIAGLSGASGEVPGEHRNRAGDEWDQFVADVKENGVKEPLFITVDYGKPPVISEGNHRRDAAVEAGLAEVPVEVRYYGHAEQSDTLFQKRYNSDQPRDERGRWTDGFGGAYLEGLSPESLPYGEHPGVKEVQRMKERMEDGAWEAQAAIEEHGYLMVNEAFEDEWQENPGLEDLTKAQVLTGSIEALYEAQFTESEADAESVRIMVREELQAYVDKGTVAVRAEPDAAVMILRDQRFRTQYETSTSNGYNDPRLRAKFEEGAFGYPTDLDPAMRPVYGYVAPPNERIYDGPYQYGNVKFNLKPEVKNRSTVTMGDSLKMNADYAHPSPATEVSHLSVNPYNAIQVGNNESLDLDDFSLSNYVEAQIHGGINASDIASIDILGGTKFANEQPFWDELYAQAESLGIPVKVVE